MIALAFLPSVPPPSPASWRIEQVSVRRARVSPADLWSSPPEVLAAPLYVAILVLVFRSSRGEM